MRSSLRLCLFVASLFALLLIVLAIKKKKLNIKYSIVWFMWSILCLFMAAYPKTFYMLSDMLGIEMPVNAVFLIMIGLLYALTLYSYLMISKHNDEIIQLTYEIASLKKELDDYKKNNER